MPVAPCDDRRLVLHVFPGFGVGGAQIRFTQVANHWGDRWRHLIVAINGDLACRERLDPRLTVSFPTVALDKAQPWRSLARIRAALAAWRPDVLVTSNWGAIDWAIARHAPGARHPLHIHTEDGFGPEESDRQLPRRVWTRRLVLRHATVVLPSRRLFDLATEVWRLPARQLRWIPNGVDIARFAAPAGPPPWAEPQGGCVIGTIATLRPEKNIARLIEAFAIVAASPPRDLAPLNLVIVGDGPCLPDLRTLAARLGLGARVIFTGHLGEAARAVGAFDLFALSSDTEQMPLSVLEAMAAGRAVVATDVGDIRQMVAAENLPFLAARSAPALAAAMAVLLNDADQRASIGLANQAKAARDYNQQTMFDAYAKLFDGANRPEVMLSVTST